MICKHCKKEPATSRNKIYCSRECYHAGTKFNVKAWKAARYKSRVDAKMCPSCDRPIDSAGRANCSACILVRAERRLARVESGTCVHCRNPAVAALYCLHHWFTRIGHTWGLTVSNGGIDMLKRLWAKQKGQCALTGDVLVPGDKRVALDHIVPRSRGGLSVEGNLQWVTYESNRAKNDMTNDELVAWCKKILSGKDLVLERTN